MRNLINVFTAALLALTFGACQDDLTSPESAASSTASSPELSANVQQNSVVTDTKDLEVDVDVNLPDGATGEVTLTRHLRSGTISWKLTASNMPLETAYTVWVLGEDGLGRGAGGLVRPSGDVTASGNHCLDALGDGDPGFNDCDLVDAKDAITFFLVAHEEWEPGDVAEFRTPTGGDGGFYGQLSASFDEFGTD